LGARGGSTITTETASPVPRHGGDHSVRYLANPLVVRDEQVADCVQCDALWAQLCAGGGSTIASETAGPVPRHGGDHPVGDLADAIVKAVRDVNVASRVHGDAAGVVQLSASGRTVAAAEPLYPISRN